MIAMAFKASRESKLAQRAVDKAVSRLKEKQALIDQLKGELANFRREQQVLPLLMSVRRHQHQAMPKYTIAVDFCIDSHLRALWRVSPHDHAAEVRSLCEYYADQMASEMFKQIMEQRDSQFFSLTNGL